MDRVLHFILYILITLILSFFFDPHLWSEGLILLTSNGKLPNAILRGSTKTPKIYEVRVDRVLRKDDARQLADGVVITTVAQRDGKRAKPLTAKTKCCEVTKVAPRCFRIVLMEGRNRQIRKMCEALGYVVVDLHRVKVMDVNLDGLNVPGDWMRLKGKELALVRDVLFRSEHLGANDGR